MNSNLTILFCIVWWFCKLLVQPVGGGPGIEFRKFHPDSDSCSIDGTPSLAALGRPTFMPVVGFNRIWNPVVGFYRIWNGASGEVQATPGLFSLPSTSFYLAFSE